MFSYLFGKKTARQSTSKARPSGFRPQCEVLEDRLVMTSLAGISTASIPSIALPNAWLLSLPPAQAVNLTTEPHDQVAGMLTTKTTELYSFQLQKGDYLQADLGVGSVPFGGRATASMSILNASGTTLDTSAPGTPYGFNAPASGTYYAEINGAVTGGLVPAAAYQLDLHRLALAQGTQSVATLAQTGSMYAFLNGNTLNITGPGPAATKALLP